MSDGAARLAQGLSFDTRRTTPSSPALLVHGDSTSSGSTAIQLLLVAGCRALVVCPLSNFALVRSLGAVEAFDYHDSDCSVHIRAYTFDQLRYAIDCISTTSSTAMYFGALSSQVRINSRYVSLDAISTKELGTRSEVSARAPSLHFVGRPGGSEGSFPARAVTRRP